MPFSSSGSKSIVKKIQHIHTVLNKTRSLTFKINPVNPAKTILLDTAISNKRNNPVSVSFIDSETLLLEQTKKGLTTIRIQVIELS